MKLVNPSNKGPMDQQPPYGLQAENAQLRRLLLDALYLFRGAIPEGAEYDPDGNKWLAETKAILNTE